MSGDIRNYNLAFEVFLSAVEEYKKFITGLDKEMYNQYTLEVRKESEKTEEDPEKIATDNLTAKILDRTVGAHTTLGMSKLLNDFAALKEVTHRSDLILSCYNGKSVDDITISDTSDVNSSDEKLISILDFVDTNPDPNQNTTLESIGLNSATTAGEADKFSAPSLSAHVIRKGAYSPSSRQSQHLPIFFSAITDVEMSRCQPFLEVKFVYPARFFPNQVGNPKMSYTRFFGFDKNDTFTNPLPINNSTGLDENETAFESYSYMNLFTSPQTMVNANYNSENNTFSSILESSFGFDFATEDGDRARADRAVLDPFQPFLSLISLDITEQDAGVGGLLSTRNGVLKLKLHDKSRLKQVSPMLAVDEFANSHFVIEYGWTHPDSKLTSTNTVGKYINNLRNVSAYNIKNVSYGFGADNTVDITIDIITKGSSSVTPRVSSGAGVFQSLSAFAGVIDLAVNSAQGEGVKKASETRPKSTVLNDKLSSPSRLVTFDKLQAVNELIKAKDFSIESNADRKKFFEALRKAMTGYIDANGKPIDGTSGEDGAAGLSYFKTEGEAFQEKWETLRTTPDPFQLATRFEDTVTTENVWRGDKKFDQGAGQLLNFYLRDSQIKAGIEPGETVEGDYHVTLGKLFTKFVALPMATAGVFDDVQVFFYPVNHQAGGARRHTTASVPINAEAFKNMLDKSLQGENDQEKVNSRKLSAIGFVNHLKRYLSDRSISAYDLQEDSKKISAGSIKETKSNFQKMTHEEKIAFLTALPSSPSDNVGSFDSVSFKFKFDPATTAGATPEVKKEKEDKAIQDFLEGITKAALQQIEANLNHIYENDGVKLCARSGVFQPIRLDVFFEVAPAIDEKTAEEKGLGSILGPFAEVVKTFKDSKKDDIPTEDQDGIFVDKTILRIHVHDAGAIPHSDEVVLGLGSREDGKVIKPPDLEPATQQNITLSDKFKNSRNFWKSVIASKYPTIIHGNSSSVIKSVNVDSNVPPIIANVQIVEGYERTIARQVVDENEAQFDEVQFFPTAVNVSMMGCPMMLRGTTLFLDLKTGTSLDNLYQANTVTHSITPGDFTTTVNLLAPNQNIVASTRNKVLSKIKALEEESQS